SLIAMSSMWQIVSERTAVSTGQIVCRRLLTHSMKLRRWLLLRGRRISSGPIVAVSRDLGSAAR
ncbi:MAG: hypothetical protein ACYSWQ_11600, partial [Planctomycetota bacterium]